VYNTNLEDVFFNYDYFVLHFSILIGP